MSEMWQRLEGQVVNNTFRLHQYLGGSKHSAVFLTQQAGRKDQKAAIKLVPTDPSTAELQLSRWAQAAKLTHPHLLRSYHMGRCQLADVALLFLVMEYAEENLSQVLCQRPLTADEAHDTFVPTLDALAYLHREGFAHGRLKPGNIMAVGDQVKLTSDGLWWMGEPSIEVGNSSPYDPPEKATAGISPAGDVWSLGLTVVEALTCRLPAIGENGDATPPATLPAPFLDIARGCLRREPQQRSSIADIASQLQGARPAQKEKKASSTADLRAALGKPRFLMTAAAVALLLLVILTVPRLFKHRADVPPSTPTATVRPTPQPKTEKPKAGMPASGADKKRSAATAPPAPPAEPPSRPATSTATRGDVVHQVIPNVPQSARDTIQGTVRVNVRVGVDRSGKVATANFDSTGPSKYFARLAMQAARDWKFTPAQAQSARREWILRFEFQRNGTRVHPFQVTR